MNRQIMKLFKYLLAVLLCIPGTTFATGYCARIPYTMSGGKMVVKAEINGKQGNFIWTMVTNLWNRLHTHSTFNKI